jgi:hypothetical protein
MSSLSNSSSFEAFQKSPFHSTKYKNYFKIYDRLFTKYRNIDITFVEVGVLQGGSLFMWREFLGPKARIIGVDLNPNAKKWEEHGFEIFIGDQSRSDFWLQFKFHVPSFDVLLDDGGHTNLQQLVTLFELSDSVSPGGMIVIEDTHASYQREFGNPGKTSFINISKCLIDHMNRRFDSQSKGEIVMPNLLSIEYFESMAVFHFGEVVTEPNAVIFNNGENMMNLDFRYENHGRFLQALQKIENVLSVNYVKVGQTRKILGVFNFILGNIVLKSFFKLLFMPLHKLVQFVIAISFRVETLRYLSQKKF